MSGLKRNGEGAGYKWLLAHKSYQEDDCIVWPMCRIKNGYGTVYFAGKQLYAHRLMCEMVKGPPPSPTHEAAHSCGNGHGGCVNPRHLSWKTISENLRDCRRHGTHVRNRSGAKGKLTPRNVMLMRRLKGIHTQAEIAAQFGVSEPTMRDILSGRTWKTRGLLNDSELRG